MTRTPHDPRRPAGKKKSAATNDEKTTSGRPPAHVLVFTDQYSRRAARFLGRHPQLREPYRKTLLLLEANPYHPSLRLNALGGKLEGLHSVSINLSYRITLELIIRDRQIVPVNVGDHDAVY